jgi:hypothetical protein
MSIATECQIKQNETLDGKDYLEYMRTVLKGKQDPVWWIKEYLGIEFEPHHKEQEAILREWYRDRYNPTLTPYKFMFLLAGMRSGKTALDSMVAAYQLFDVVSLPRVPWQYYHLIKNQLVTISVLSISKDQNDDGLWGNLQNYLTDNPWFDQWSDLLLRSEYADVPSKKVGVRVLSSSSSTNIGRSNIFVALDELDSFENTEGKRGSWKVYSKMVNSTQTFGKDGRLCAISSSNDDPNSIMNTLVNQTKERDLVTPYNERTFLAIVKPTWEMNTAISEADLREEYKDNLAAFYRDFACMPGMYTGMEFPAGVKLYPMDNVLKTKTSPFAGYPRVVSLDPAAKNDAFGISIAYRNGPQIIVDGVDRFTKSGKEVFINADDIDKYLDALYLSFNVRWLVTDTWMYPNLTQKAMGRGIQVIKHIVYKEDYDRVKGKIVDGTLQVIDDPILRRELLGLKVINDKKVDHPLQGSKDMADTVANCVWCLTEAETLEPVKPRLLMAMPIGR